jgi:PAS domain-containing protein
MKPFTGIQRAACVACASGKRKCDGNRPCERCLRLGKECTFAEDSRRRYFRKNTEKEGGFGSLVYLGTPKLTRLALPQLLFPWQDIRLHSVSASSQASKKRDSAALDSQASYLEQLWDGTLSCGTTLSTTQDTSNAKSLLLHLDDIVVSTPTLQQSTLSQPLAPQNRSITSTTMGSDDSSTELAELGSLALVFSSAEPSMVAIYSLSIDADIEFPAREEHHEPLPSYEHSILRRIVCNPAALELFGWSQSEIDLRVQSHSTQSNGAYGAPLRWLHPDHILPRSLVEMNAKRDLLVSETYHGVYLQRQLSKEFQTSFIYKDAMTTLANALKSASSIGSSSIEAPPITSSSNAATASLETNPLRLLRATSAGSSRSDNKAWNHDSVEMFDLVCALHDLDSCMEYLPFEATEEISYSYITHPTGNSTSSSLHMSVSRFLNVNKPKELTKVLSSTELLNIDNPEFDSL